MSVADVDAQTTNRWTNSGSGLWQTAANWSAGVPTNSNAAVLITNALTKTVTLDSFTPAGNRTISNLTITGVGTGVNTLLLSNSGTATPLRILNGLAINPGGSVIVTNAFLRVDGVSGNGFDNDGSVTLLNNGMLLLTNIFSAVGNTTNSSMVIKGGTAQIGDIGVGETAVGTLTVSGGTLTLLGDFSGLFVGDFDGSTGAVWVTGGTVLLTNDYAFIGYEGLGQMTISNVTVQATDVVVGEIGQGTLTVASGGLSLLFTLTVGDIGGSAGAVWLSGGQLLVPNDVTIIGYDGAGQLTISNGTMQADTVTVGLYNAGTLTIAGGTMTVSTSLIFGDCLFGATGSGRMTGGNLSVVTSGHKGVLEVRSGTFTQTAGTLVVDSLVLTNACGHFIHTGGTLIMNSAPVVDPAFDADGDGLPNSFEDANGLDKFNPTDANADKDGDGQSNLKEFLAGTDPSSATSAFRITAITQTLNNLRVTWTMGSGKTNALQRATGAANGSFNTNSFVTIFTVTNTVGTVTNYLDVGVLSNSARYYRIRLVP